MLAAMMTALFSRTTRKPAGRHRRLRAMWAAAALSGALARLACDAAVTVDIDPPEGGGVRIHWRDSSPNDGYALLSRPELTSGAWAFAETADAWPVGGSNRLATADGPSRFFCVARTDRGRLVAGTAMSSLTASQINFFFSLYGIPLSATYSVTIYRIAYETFDHRGLSTLVSGALIVPVGPTQAPVVSYQHGTIFERTAAPSNPNAADHLVGVGLATGGYIVTLPDFPGLGTNSPPVHPYIHARSEAVASVDLLRAAGTFISNNLAIRPNGQLFLAGYSQGGHATLALQRELEERHAAEFPVTASAPMAGPHDLSGTMKTVLLSDTAYANPEYVPYLLFGYNAVYGFFAAPSDVLKAPYDTTLPPLFDGAHSGSDIGDAMPVVPKQIFKDEFVSDFAANTNHPFHVALRANDTFRWTPQAPTRFYHCAGDTVVPQANSLVAYSNFLARGAADVSFVDPAPAADHGDGALPSFLAAKAWFDTLRTP